MNKDFILLHKSLFEFIYGIYGCDYFIQAKIKDQKSNKSMSTMDSKGNANDLNSHASYLSGNSIGSSFQSQFGQVNYLSNQGNNLGLSLA